MPATLPGPSGCVGRALVTLTGAWAHQGRAVARASTRRRAPGGGWQVQQRAAGWLPVSTLDVAADGGTAGWHGGVWGGKLHRAAVGGSCFIPRAADLTQASVHHAPVAPAVRDELPLATRVVRGATP